MKGFIETPYRNWDIWNSYIDTVSTLLNYHFLKSVVAMDSRSKCFSINIIDTYKIAHIYYTDTESALIKRGPLAISEFKKPGHELLFSVCFSSMWGSIVKSHESTSHITTLFTNPMPIGSIGIAVAHYFLKNQGDCKYCSIKTYPELINDSHNRIQRPN